MTGTSEQIPRFSKRHIVNHIVMLASFLGLVLTGLPQKYAGEMWAKGIVMLVGGVERVRFVHHLLGTIMALQLVWHFVEGVWLHLVRRLPMPMIPKLSDAKDFLQQIEFNIGMEKRPPRMDRYTFAEKLEYLALVWGTIVMVITGLFLLYPVRWTALVPGEVILAAKAAHGGEAILAFLSILTWHAYFVHIRHWNTAIFTGKMDAEAYTEEHPLELARLRRGEERGPAPIRLWRVVVFVVVTVFVVGAIVAAVAWMRGTEPGWAAFKMPRMS